MNQHWYVMRSKPRQENFLVDQLQARKVEAFCLHVRVQVVNPRARKFRPYFPGYVFLRMDNDDPGRASISFIPGSVGLVTFGGEPAHVPAELLKAIQRKVAEINASGGEGLHDLEPGDPVVIETGPFSGYEAIFDARLPGSDRVRVLLKFLRDRQLPVDLPAGQVRSKRPRS